MKEAKSSGERYTLAEIKARYFPHRDLSSLTAGGDEVAARAAFLRLLDLSLREDGQQGKEDVHEKRNSPAKP